MGIVFGTLCLLGLVFLLAGGRRHRRWHGHHHHHRHHGRCGGRRRWERHDDERYWDEPERGSTGDRFVRMARRGLDLREEQTEYVDQALRDARKSVDRFAADLRETRDDLAAAVTGELVDDARLAAVFESHDDAIRQVRKDVVEAVKKVHAALDPEQRTRLAKLFDPAAGRWV